VRRKKDKHDAGKIGHQGLVTGKEPGKESPEPERAEMASNKV